MDNTKWHNLHLLGLCLSSRARASITRVYLHISIKKENFPEGMWGEKTINRFLSAEFSRATGFVRNPLPELNTYRISIFKQSINSYIMHMLTIRFKWISTHITIKRISMDFTGTLIKFGKYNRYRLSVVIGLTFLFSGLKSHNHIISSIQSTISHFTNTQ